MDNFGGQFFIIIMGLFFWTIFWKGIALWRAANRGDTWWFIALLLVNTLGILEIIYLFVFAGAKLSDFKLKHRR